MFSAYRKSLLALSLLLLAGLATFQLVSAQIYLPLIHHGSDAAGTNVRDTQAETTAAPLPATAAVLNAAGLPKGKKLDIRPTWEITMLTKRVERSLTAWFHPQLILGSSVTFAGIGRHLPVYPSVGNALLPASLVHGKSGAEANGASD